MIHMDQEWALELAATDRESSLFRGITVLRFPGLYRRALAWSQLIFSDAPARSIEMGFRELAGELGNASPQHSVVGRPDPYLLERLKPVLERLRHDEDNPSLAELAGIAGMTKYQLVRAVKEATGLPPLAWRQNNRIVAARQLLKAGHPIADTAQKLGFTDQSHFHRVFRAHVAAAPGEYRA
ncbi:helix-turn-helix transcriptional regulator [Paenarthrobacter sp. S56]|uniref:helix-turn-helix transcriptional regulator n=1 Tax=Paenarthrobacter sp. S56 TaxID=3138179 RepID=UPI00321BD96A